MTRQTFDEHGVISALVGVIVPIVVFCGGMFWWGIHEDRKIAAHDDLCVTRCPVTVEADHCRSEDWSEWTIARVCGGGE